jgi:hypothetical protein
MSRKKKKGARRQLKRPPRTPQDSGLGDDVLQDMRPLFGGRGDPSAHFDELMHVILDSGDLADEPELAGIYLDPLLCARTYAEVGKELGFDPRAAAELPEEEREDIDAQMRAESLHRLLTDDMRQDVLKGLNDLRVRLKRSGKRRDAARVAALQSFLDRQREPLVWSMNGLVQAIFHRSLSLGFELIEASVQALEPDEGEPGTSWIDRLAHSASGEKLDALLGKTPGLGSRLESQADRIWEEGVHAIYTGELHLGLYSEDELEGGAAVIASAMGFDSVEQMPSGVVVWHELPEGMGSAIMAGLSSYLDELFTPERLEQSRARFDVLLRDPDYRGPHLPYILMLRQYVMEENAVEYGRKALLAALLGEINAYGETASEGEN